jgi:hypothetical protein
MLVDRLRLLGGEDIDLVRRGPGMNPPKKNRRVGCG